MRKETKFNYFKVIQQNYGFGWESVSHYTCNSMGTVTELSGRILINKTGRQIKETLLSHDLKEYRYMGYPTRVVFKREKKQINS